MLGHHFTWFDLLGVTPYWTSVALTVMTTFLIILFCLVGRWALGTGEEAIRPAGKLSLKGVIELFVEFIYNLSHSLLGPKGLPYFGLFAAIFLFIFLNNALGLMPGMSSSTIDLNATLSVALFSFLFYNAVGFSRHGWHYISHFTGPVWWLAWLLLPIELISHVFRPFTLGLRLSVNMTADHMLLETFLELVPWFIPIVFFAFGFFISGLQAYVFTLLSVAYVMMAMSDDH